MSKGEWKIIINHKVMDKENKEWTATRGPMTPYTPAFWG